jgi:serine/threonine-protein kinase
MPIGPGTRLGPYEVTALIGEGGMGKVWRAHHTGLKRDDALKVLPDAFAADPDRLARFRREAQVLASLNHPNIAHVHGLEQSDGVQALVMELVEGPTLADRIAQGPIPVDEALPIAKQIAEALEAAHERSIIHRDLKPANVKVRPDGTVKVLDFGLAKALEPLSSSDVDATASPTITSPAMMTGVGMLLGTAAYMSPEQARGKPVDKRSDIWAFGCVLYEMLTGKRAFEGDEVSDVLASVLAREPDWTLLPRSLSPVLVAFLKRCLHKDRKQRIGDAQSLRLALEGAFDTAAVAPASHGENVRARPRWRRAFPVFTALLVGGLIVGIATWNLWPTVAPPTVTRFEYEVPQGQRLRATGRPVMALSADGRHLVYNVTDGLYVRLMDALQPRLIPGTEANLTNPFFSPDGNAVGYWQAGALKRVNVSGGAALIICEATNPFGVSWSQDNMIFLGQPAGIMRVSANGGTPELVVKANEGEQVHGPQLLGDGDSLLFSVTTAKGPTRWDQAQIVVQSLRTGERKVVVRGGSDARYVSTGHLIYAVGDALFAVAFDADRLEVQGGAVSVVQGVTRVGVPTVNTGTANYAVSDDGTLVYVTASVTAQLSGRLVWVDREGRAEPLSDRQAPYRGPRVSPDGARVAVGMRSPDGNEDIWVVDVERGTHTRLTSDPASDSRPVWTPDGTRIVFTSNRGGPSALYWMAADGSGAAEPLTKIATAFQAPSSFLPGSTTFAFEEGGGERGVDFDIFTMTPGESPVRQSEGPFREQGPVFSADGRWLAYTSDETGQPEIYVKPYPAAGGRVAISLGGGHSPRWSVDGRELFYRNGRQMIAVAVEAGQTIRVGKPRTLFEGDYMQEPSNAFAHNYDVSREGQRFLMVAPVGSATTDGEDARPRIVVVEHWLEELKRLVPVN